MNDIRDLLPGRMRERTFQLKARRDAGVAWHEPQFVECKQCGRRATRQIWAKSLFVCPNCGNHQPIGAYYRLSLVLDSGSFRELDAELAPQDVLGFPGYPEKLSAQTQKTGLSEAAVAAVGRIGGVAVAFACKDAVENLISGFIIVFNKPFRVGDFIAVGELSGTVEDIAVRSTTLRALDGSRYVLPNTALTNQSIINYADMEKRLINQTFTLHYKHSRTDLERFEQDLRALLQADPAVVQDDIRTDFVNYGAHGMDVQVYYYVIAPTVVELGQIKNRLNLQIKELLDKEGFELAYNSATVYLEQETEGKDQ